jgi:hypothetical protein
VAAVSARRIAKNYLRKSFTFNEMLHHTLGGRRAADVAQTDEKQPHRFAVFDGVLDGFFHVLDGFLADFLAGSFTKSFMVSLSVAEFCREITHFFVFLRFVSEGCEWYAICETHHEPKFKRL